MRPLFHLVLHALLAMLLLAAGSASAAVHKHGAMQDATPVALAAEARPAAPHAACDPHRHTGSAMATHGSTPRCRQACLALSALATAASSRLLPSRRAGAADNTRGTAA